jgi:hypothetical protein
MQSFILLLSLKYIIIVLSFFFFLKIEVQDLGFLLEDALDDVQIECLVIYIGKERHNKLIPSCVIS